MESVKKRSKGHTRYYTKDGRLCVGVTTVLGKISKPHLIVWANKLGLDGIDSTKYVDSLAEIGTLIHHLVECDVKGLSPALGDYTQNEIEIAQKAFKKWVDWKAKNKFELIASELQLAHDGMQFGGTCDVYCKLNDKFCVLDIKTSKACYAEQRTQTVAYKELLIANEKPVDECRIIRIGRSENEGFDDILVGAHELHWKRFQAYLAAYWADKALENAGG